MFDVASSRIRIRGSARSARAIEISWRSPAEARAALADDVIEPVLEPRGDAVDADGGGGRPHLLVGGVRLREADVVGDRAAEEERILEDDAELAPVADELDVAEIRPVDANRALVGVVEAGDQLRRRRLAAT